MTDWKANNLLFPFTEDFVFSTELIFILLKTSYVSAFTTLCLLRKYSPSFIIFFFGFFVPLHTVLDAFSMLVRLFLPLLQSR